MRDLQYGWHEFFIFITNVEFPNKLVYLNELKAHLLGRFDEIFT